MNAEEKPSHKLRVLNSEITALLQKFQDETGFFVDGVEVSKSHDYNPEKKRAEDYVFASVKIS